MEVNENAFNENLVIQKLKQLPIWTINNNDPNRFTKSKEPTKVPLDPKALLAYDQYRGFSKRSQHVPYNALARLTDFEKVVSVNVKETHVLAIDVEKVTILTDQYKDVRETIEKYCCANYVEKSRHGGRHYLLEIPDILMDDYPDLFEANNFKTPMFEMFPTGVHHMTLTRKVIPRPYVDPNSTEYINKVDQFLQYASKLADQYGLNKRLDLHHLNRAATETPFVKELAERIIQVYPFEYVKRHDEFEAGTKHAAVERMRQDPKENPFFKETYEKFAYLLNDESLDQGQSRFDYSVCAHYLYVANQWYCQTIPTLAPNGRHGLSQWVDNLPYDQFVALVRLFVKKFMDLYGLSRDKHDSIRGGVDYLTYLIDGLCQREGGNYPSSSHIVGEKGY